MKTLVQKEIRLMMPAFAGALLLVVVLDWVWTAAAPYSLGLGITLLGLSSFGREMGFKTLPFILAQPVERASVWSAKVKVLAISMALIFSAWWLLVSLRFHFQISLGMVPLIALYMVVLAVGGLWTTLLLRQMAPAFWLTILIPGAVGITIKALGQSDWLIFTVLAFYSIGGFLLARWQFFHAEDIAWTGGVISLWRGSVATNQSVKRDRQPWTALIAKEFQLHQVTIVGIVVLFVLHLGVILLRKVGAHVFYKNTLSVLEMFGVLWLFVSLLAGCQSVAEERQFGTLDGLLCLPISRRLQFSIKLIFAVVLGGLCSAALLCVAERIAGAMGIGTNLDVMVMFRGVWLYPLFEVFVGLSLIGFYASTLTRNLMQALATAVVASLLFWGIDSIASIMHAAFGWRLWPVVAFPALSVAVIYLSYGNFKWQFESARRWSRNVLGLIAVLVLVAGSITAIYHRAWDLTVPLEEGVHGPARLTVGKPILKYNQFGQTTLVLPDGRLWTDWLFFGAPKQRAKHFISGSNWVGTFRNGRDTVGLRSDGTLWVSEEPQKLWEGSDLARMVRFGTATNWQSLAPNSQTSLVLMKQDGTLWRWGTETYFSTKQYPGLRGLTPERLGDKSNWIRILRGQREVYAWEQTGRAWIIFAGQPGPEGLQLALGVAAMPVPILDHINFKHLDSGPYNLPFDVGIRDDGTLWKWESNTRQFLSRPHRQIPGPTQIGKDSDWAALASAYGGIIALKTDGSIWTWDLAQWVTLQGPRLDMNAQVMADELQMAPTRLGTNTDWVAVARYGNEFAALAADGVLWKWPRLGLPEGFIDYSDLWLTPTRNPVRIVSVFDE